MRVLVTGAGGYIGGELVRALQADGHEVLGTTRGTLDLLAVGNPHRFGTFDTMYLCAAKTRFIECEDDPTAYRINVDAQLELAKAQIAYTVVFLSSEAVERALHTNYGMHKALAEVVLRGACRAVIARICGKVNTESNLKSLCAWLVGLKKAHPGVYRWTP